MRDARQNLTHFHELLAELSHCFCPAAAAKVPWWRWSIEASRATRISSTLSLLALRWCLTMVFQSGGELSDSLSVRSSCPALRLLPPALPSVSDSLCKRCTVQTHPQTLALFSLFVVSARTNKRHHQQVPTDSQGLWGAHGNISATRGRQDMRFCVCGSPRGDLSHIASVTLGCSRSDFSGANRRVQDHTCGG